MKAKLYVQIDDGGVYCIAEGDLTAPTAEERKRKLANTFRQIADVIAIDGVGVDLELDGDQPV